MTLRLRLIRLQTNSGNQFPENGAFGCDGKRYFLEIEFLLTEIFSLDHGKRILSLFSLQNTSGKREREREREERAQIRERERERRESPDRAAAPTIAPRRRAAQSTRSRGAIVDRRTRSSIARVDRRETSALVCARRSRSTIAILHRAARRRDRPSLSLIWALSSLSSLSLSLSLFLEVN